MEGPMWIIFRHRSHLLSLIKFVFGFKKIAKSMYKPTHRLKRAWLNLSFNLYNIKRINWEKMHQTHHLFGFQ